MDEKTMRLLENIIGSFETGKQENVSFPRRRESHEKQDEIPAFAGMTGEESSSGIGLPLGNLTSQLFANVYMNELDQWVKHKTPLLIPPLNKGRRVGYIRYADDFIFLSEEKNYLELLIPVIGEFLKNRLKLFLHPDKVFIKTIVSGVDFLGWVNFNDHRILRKVAIKRMFQKIKAHTVEETAQSYWGLLQHGNAQKLQKWLFEEY